MGYPQDVMCTSIQNKIRTDNYEFTKLLFLSFPKKYASFFSTPQDWLVDDDDYGV